MADPRPNAPGPEADGDRDSKIEQLLLAGLDHYFAGDHERAVGVWTRVLFLDRGHARARAYIERARGALAERQRESEELVHRGVIAFERGATEEARRLLSAVVERGGEPQDVAQAYLDRLTRLEAPGPDPDRPAARRATRRRRPEQRPGAPRARVRWGVPLVVAAGLAVLAGYALTGWPGAPWSSGPWPVPAEAGVTAGPAGELPVPGPGELAVGRARTLAGQGRVRDALRVLDQVSMADGARPEADRLRADLQRALLGGDARLAPSAAEPLPGVSR